MGKRWRESAVNAETPQNEQKRPKFARYGKRGEIIPLILKRRIRAARGITERIEKMAYKYPYIPREYYAAVMFACKIVRETGNRTKAIRTAANYYDVDEEELEKHFNKRNAAGRKEKKSEAKGRKYRYFVVGTFYGCDASGMQTEPSEMRVYKGLTEKTVLNRFDDLAYDRRNDTGSAYSPYRIHSVLSVHDTQLEAVESMNELKKKYRE